MDRLMEGLPVLQYQGVLRVNLLTGLLIELLLVPEFQETLSASLPMGLRTGRPPAQEALRAHRHQPNQATVTLQQLRQALAQVYLLEQYLPDRSRPLNPPRIRPAPRASSPPHLQARSPVCLTTRAQPQTQ
jgi:hypothetical protein